MQVEILSKATLKKRVHAIGKTLNMRNENPKYF